MKNKNKSREFVHFLMGAGLTLLVMAVTPAGAKYVAQFGGGMDGGMTGGGLSAPTAPSSDIGGGGSLSQPTIPTGGMQQFDQQQLNGAQQQQGQQQLGQQKLQQDQQMKFPGNGFGFGKEKSKKKEFSDDSLGKMKEKFGKQGFEGGLEGFEKKSKDFFKKKGFSEESSEEGFGKFKKGFGKSEEEFGGSKFFKRKSVIEPVIDEELEEEEEEECPVQSIWNKFEGRLSKVKKISSLRKLVKNVLIKGFKKAGGCEEEADLAKQLWKDLKGVSLKEAGGVLEDFGAQLRALHESDVDVDEEELEE